jgi:hypothetical protein
MELVSIENMKVTYLIQLHRPAGMLYQPEALAKIVQRYQFMKYPTIEDLSKNERLFRIGKFKDIQISDFAIYSDGVIVTSVSDSDLLDDILGWSREEFGMVPAVGSVPEKSYDSGLVVKSNVDLTKAIAPAAEALAVINKAYNSGRYVSSEMAYTGVIASVDDTTFPGAKKQVKFILDRKVGIPLDQNIFYSQAPLRTKDHLDVLRSFERLASSR